MKTTGGGGVSVTQVALPFTLQKYYIFKAKEELWKFKYFHHAKKKKKHLPQKNPSNKRNQNPSRYA